MIKINNEKTIVNLSNSFLKHYGVPTFHQSIPEIDEILKGHKKIVVFLFDGMGQKIQEKCLSKTSFLRKNVVTTIDATFPPTTVASTNGFLSGKYPIENGWIGWRQFFKEYNCPILSFSNINPDTKETIRDRSSLILFEKCPYRTIFSLIEQYSPNTVTFDIKEYPINLDGPSSLPQYKARLNKILKENDDCYVYCYWTKPDYFIHQYGVNSWEVKHCVQNINSFIQTMVNTYKDTLFFVIADHGLVDIKILHIYEHQDLVDTFLHEPTLEGRTTTFMIKQDKYGDFIELFHKYYGDKFDLITKEEALANEIFGDALPNNVVNEFLGDFFAISKGEYFFFLDKEVDPKEMFKAHHAGFTEDEMKIDVSCGNI